MVCALRAGAWASSAQTAASTFQALTAAKQLGLADMAERAAAQLLSVLGTSGQRLGSALAGALCSAALPFCSSAAFCAAFAQLLRSAAAAGHYAPLVQAMAGEPALPSSLAAAAVDALAGSFLLGEGAAGGTSLLCSAPAAAWLRHLIALSAHAAGQLSAYKRRSMHAGRQPAAAFKAAASLLAARTGDPGSGALWDRFASACLAAQRHCPELLVQLLALKPIRAAARQQPEGAGRLVAARVRQLEEEEARLRAKEQQGFSWHMPAARVRDQPKVSRRRLRWELMSSAA
jgi:hypothetical protein